LISKRNRQTLSRGIRTVANKKESTTDPKSIGLQMKFTFTRAGPSTAIDSKYVTTRKLNFTNYHDCVTGKELQKFSEMDCSKEDSKSKKATMTFT